jgi:hypothetical protein
LYQRKQIKTITKAKLKNIIRTVRKDDSKWQEKQIIYIYNIFYLHY